MTARKYDPICSYPDCGRAHNARGLCGPHGAMQLRGEPLRPLQDRTGPLARPAEERFANLIELQDDGCIVWVGGRTNGGYGTFAKRTTRKSPQSDLAHRWAYEQYVEPVTRRENIRRAAAIKTACPAGHPFTADNTYIRPGTVHRKCRTCARDRDLRRADEKNAKRRDARAASRKAA